MYIEGGRHGPPGGHKRVEGSHYSLADACWDVRHYFDKWDDVDVEYGIADPRKGQIVEAPDEEEHEDDWQPEPNEHLYATGTFEYGEEHTLTISKGPAPTWPMETVEEVKELGTAMTDALDPRKDEGTGVKRGSPAAVVSEYPRTIYKRARQAVADGVIDLCGSSP